MLRFRRHRVYDSANPDQEVAAVSKKKDEQTPLEIAKAKVEAGEELTDDDVQALEHPAPADEA